MDALVKATVADYGRLDAVVNNAGITRDGLLLRMKEEDWDQVLAINLKSVFLVTRASLRHLLKNKGGWINIASVVGVMTWSAYNYAASRPVSLVSPRPWPANTPPRACAPTWWLPASLIRHDRLPAARSPRGFRQGHSHGHLPGREDVAGAVSFPALAFATTSPAKCCAWTAGWPCER